MASDTEKLKPCPFCGSDNLKLISYNSIAGVCKMVECMQCFAQVPSRATKKEAIEAWNRRADYIEVKHGQWEQVYNISPKYACTNCRHLFNNRTFNYCPNCGARMDKERRK